MTDFRRFRQILASCFAGLGLFSLLEGPAHPTSSAQSAALPEYTVKSAYLYQFTRFIDWPAEGLPPLGQPFSLCIVGDDPFGSLLEPLEEKVIEDRPVSIKRFRRVQDAGPCQILFVSESERQHVGNILEGLKDRGTLTVSDMDGFARAGGIIEFIREENKVRFFINVEAARHAGLQISSKLLNLARGIEGKPDSGD